MHPCGNCGEATIFCIFIAVNYSEIWVMSLISLRDPYQNGQRPGQEYEVILEQSAPHYYWPQMCRAADIKQLV
jgi:hypothetical protein